MSFIFCKIVVNLFSSTRESLFLSSLARMSVIPVIDPPTQKDEITKIKDLLYSQLEREMKGGSLFLLDEDGGDSLGAKKSLEELVVAGKEAVMDQMKVVVAPLRVSPLGAHIDHQLGEVTGSSNIFLFLLFLSLSL